MDIIFGLTIILYLITFLSGFTSENDKSGYLSLSVLGVCIIAFTTFLVIAFAGAAAGVGAAIAVAAVVVIGGAIILPVIGYFSGVLSSLAFAKAGSSDRKSTWFTVLGLLIVLWPLPLGAVISLIKFPERQVQKELAKERKVEAEIRRKKRIADRLERLRNGIDVYERTQKGNRYRVRLADHYLNLRPFEFLSISQKSETPYQTGMMFWGPALTEFLSRQDEARSNPDIYHLKIQTNIIKDECPYTDTETAKIWCRETKTANAIHYRPTSLGIQAFSRDLSRAGRETELAFYPSQPNNAKQTTKMELISSQSGNTWRLRKTETLQNIYGNIFISCKELTMTPKKYGNGCYIGFLLTPDVFVSMYMQSTTDNPKTDSVSSIEQSLKYWELLKSE